MKRRTVILSAVAATALVGIIGLSVANANGWGGCPKGGPMGGGYMNQGQMMGQGPMGYGRHGGGKFGRHGMGGFGGRGAGPATMLCSGQMEQKAEWMLQRMTGGLTLSEEQTAKLDAVKKAVADNTENLKTTCADTDLTKTATTPVERMAQMETGMAAMLTAMQSVRPAFDDFYQSLTPEQQQSVTAPRRGRW
ncbi:Spy/CpxP family protein refolding chaperone [Magnetospira sp. QH-2]|uniref:Spy/CpxP family protein refolding chaperone n=1 Tax=Magnetospira sp. (strain QH-2) TaxID=1288970 RepID=UPI0003E81C33|nr:Spy/CpxP family protein refolding chaperone [Magnetospira sp. QH-2]CCQ74784.1 exported protein of unknown function [Magnetospira sp. QH-2]